MARQHACPSQMTSALGCGTALTPGLPGNLGRNAAGICRRAASL